MSFTLGEKTAGELKIKLLEDTAIPILSDTRDRTITVPGRAGAYDFGADQGPRFFDLDCGFVDEVLGTDSELQQAVRDLASHLCDNDGTPRDLSLVFNREPGKTWTVRYAGSLPIERTIYHAKGFFTLPLVAYDPYAYGEEKETEATITTSPGELSVEVEGNVSTPAVIVITNQGSNTLNGFAIRREVQE